MKLIDKLNLKMIQFKIYITLLFQMQPNKALLYVYPDNHKLISSPSNIEVGADFYAHLFARQKYIVAFV